MNFELPRTYRKHGWRMPHLIGAAVMTALGGLVTWSAWADILEIAIRDEEASHIFLVPLVAAWLVWVRRGRLRQVRPEGRFFGPLIVALGWFMSSYGYNHAVQSFWHGGAVLVVLGCFLSVVGIDVVRRFLPAFIVLIFLVPVPGILRQQIAIPLQTVTAQITQNLFMLVGLPIDRSGNLLSINGVDVAIAEACNGMRMVFALALVSYAFAFGTPLRGYVRFIILAASPLSAIFCNVVRMIPTVYLYGYATQGAADLFHDISGWVMLIIAFLLLMAILKLFRWALIPVTHYTLAYD